MTPTPYRTFNFSKMPGTAIYHLMTSTIVPRPIAFVSTISPEGILNLAPFSFFNGVSSNPPCLVFSITRKPDGSKKDTLLNIEENGEFVVNSTHEWLAEKINQCSAEYPYGVSELDKVGFTAAASTHIKPPRIQESLVHMECRLETFVPIGDGTLGSATLVVGRILEMHVAEQAFTNDRVDVLKLKPLARLGGSQWAKTSEVFEQKRPTLK